MLKRAPTLRRGPLAISACLVVGDPDQHVGVHRKTHELPNQRNSLGRGGRNDRALVVRPEHEIRQRVVLQPDHPIAGEPREHQHRRQFAALVVQTSRKKKSTGVVLLVRRRKRFPFTGLTGVGIEVDVVALRRVTRAGNRGNDAFAVDALPLTVVAGICKARVVGTDLAGGTSVAQQLQAFTVSGLDCTEAALAADFLTGRHFTSENAGVHQATKRIFRTRPAAPATAVISALLVVADWNACLLFTLAVVADLATGAFSANLTGPIAARRTQRALPAFAADFFTGRHLADVLTLAFGSGAEHVAGTSSATTATEVRTAVFLVAVGLAALDFRHAHVLHGSSGVFALTAGREAGRVIFTRADAGVLTLFCLFLGGHLRILADEGITAPAIVLTLVLVTIAGRQ